MAEQIVGAENIGLLDRIVCERIKGHPLNKLMKEEGRKNTVDRFFGIVSLVSGATTGFIDGFGLNIPLTADVAAIFGPTLLQSATEWYVGGSVLASVERYDETTLPYAARGAALGAYKTAVGYCVGYTAADLIKKHLLKCP